MTFEPKTLAEQIDCLARLTGAPRTFVLQVKELFSRKGISLQTDAAPYLRALEEAFRREETIRANAERARENITTLAQNFNRIGRSYVRQLEHLKKLRSGLAPGAETRSKNRRSRVPRSSHEFMMKQEHDHLPMVPGPDETQ